MSQEQQSFHETERDAPVEEKDMPKTPHRDETECDTEVEEEEEEEAFPCLPVYPMYKCCECVASMNIENVILFRGASGEQAMCKNCFFVIFKTNAWPPSSVKKPITRHNTS